jgi:hypothetical protein
LALNGATIEEAGFSSGIGHIRRRGKRCADGRCRIVSMIVLAFDACLCAKTFTNLSE